MYKYEYALEFLGRVYYCILNNFLSFCQNMSSRPRKHINGIEYYQRKHSIIVQLFLYDLELSWEQIDSGLSVFVKQCLPENHFQLQINYSTSNCSVSIIRNYENEKYIIQLHILCNQWESGNFFIIQDWLHYKQIFAYDHQLYNHWIVVKEGNA